MNMNRKLTLMVFPVSIALLFGCAAQNNVTEIPKNTAPDNTDENSSEIAATASVIVPESLIPTLEISETQWGLTHHRLDGNRLVSGLGDFPHIIPVDIHLNGLPKWLVAAPFQSGSVWVVALENGDVQAFLDEDGSITPLGIQPANIPPGMPPVVRVRNGNIELFLEAPSSASSLTHAIPLSDFGDEQAFITDKGDVAISDLGDFNTLAVNALTDSRILRDDENQLLTLNQPTDRYAHGVLGDAVEAGGFVIIETSPELRVVNEVTIPAPAVIEGIAPIWADLNQDGEKEIIFTQSDAQNGAKIVIYAESGELIAEGPPIGQGYRWRHQLAVAPFGPNGEIELAVVRTPHIGGVVEFYQLQADQLEIVATLPGFSSHTLGSRNLDNALAGDFDGDGIIELLLPDQSHQNLGAVHRTAAGAEVDWWLTLDGTHTTNLAAVTYSNGQIGLGVGTDNHILRLWLPERR